MSNFSQQQGFSSFTILDSKPGTATGQVSKKFMAGVFTWMFFALGLSAVFAILFTSSPNLLSYLLSPNDQGGFSLNMLGWGVLFAPMVFVMGMSFAYNRLSVPALTALFLAYAAINGISFSFILLTYTTGSVIGCFASAAIMFGIMAIMGYTTDKDLTNFGSILTMGLVGMVIAIMINIFLKSDGLGYLISIVGVAVFTGLTAYDVQKLKRIGAGIEFQGTPANDVKKLSLMGALNLYLDFINLFLMMLRLFGNRRN